MPSAPRDGINEKLARARAAGEQLEPDLQAAYEASLRECGRTAALRFSESASLVAAAKWEPPTVQQVLGFQADIDDVVRLQREMLARIAGVTTSEILGVSFDVSHTVAQGMLDKLGLRAADIAQELRVPVAAAIAEGWAKGLSVPHTADLIRSRVTSLSPARAEMLARTDLIGLSNGAGQIAVQQLNEASEKAGQPKVIKTKTWLSAGDGRVRPTHEEANGQTVPIDQPYSVGGFSLMYPGDPSGPSDEVIRCRCTETFNEEVDVAAPTPPPKQGQPGRSDLVNQLVGNADDTRGRWIQPGGAYTPERQALHRQIVEHFLGSGRAVPVGERPRATFMAGGSGAGKSTVKKAITERGELPKHYVDIDPDGIKEMLPEYQQLLDAGERRAAMLVHEESSDIAKMVLNEAEARRFNVVIDGTGNSESGKFVGKLLKQESAGYDVDVIVVDVRTSEAVARAMQRAERSGRYVPESVIRQIHRDVSARFDEWQDIDAVKRWQVWANDERPPKLIAHGARGGINVEDRDRFLSFLRKADESLERPDTPVTGVYRTQMRPQYVDQEAQDAVAEVMGRLTGPLPDRALQKLRGLRDETLPVKSVLQIKSGALGTYYRRVDDQGKPEKIEVSSVARSEPGVTILHELGHFIDNMLVQEERHVYSMLEALHRPEAAGLFARTWQGVLEGFLKTTEYRVLTGQLEKHRDASGDPNLPAAKQQWHKEAAEHIEYLLSPHEVWARAFAQYMAEGNPRLHLEIQHRLGRDAAAHGIPTQWEAAGWRVMRAAVEQVLRDLGLLEPPPPVTAGGNRRAVIDPRLLTRLVRGQVVLRSPGGHAVLLKSGHDLSVSEAVGEHLSNVESHSAQDRAH